MRIWSQQAGFFSRHNRVIAVDMPGHGKSSWHALGLDDMADELCQIVTHAGCGTVAIVSSSFGGLLALRYAARFPQAVRCLIFVGSLPRFIKTKDFPFGLESARVRKLKEQLASDYPAILNVFFRSLLTPAERQNGRGRWLLQCKQGADVAQRPALEHLLSIIEKEDCRKELEGTAIPLQFIHGTEDYISAPAFARYIKERMPGVRVDAIDGCGHFPFLTQPERFNGIVQEFLEAHAS